MKKQTILAALLAVSLSFVACKKEETKVEDTTDENAAPTCTLTYPASETFIDIYQADSTIVYKANASDEDGTITQVEFFLDRVSNSDGYFSIGVDTESPFEVSHLTDTYGYDVKAVATDNKGKTKSSSVVRFGLIDVRE